MGLVIYSNAGGDGDLLLTKPSLPCKSISAKEKDKAVYLTWEDPDSPEDTTLYSEWASTRIVRKEGGFPVDENDGIVVVTSTTKNEYKDTAYVDSGLTNGTTYYYRAFTCSADGVYNTADSVQLSVTPRPFRTMTVVIDLNDSNPATCGSYADDAVDMPSGKTEEAITAWQEFFGYRPCLFKDGKVVGYLNPNDYTKFEDGTPADITAITDAGDVMVEFPRRGIKINKSGKVITVTMTDDPDDPDFTYYAHTRGKNRREYFYLGAYYGTTHYGVNGTCSRSGLDANYLDSLMECRYYAHKKGAGYDIMTWYQYMFIQVMYVLQFHGNLNSESTVGIAGTENGSSHPPTSGSLDKKGLIYGSSRQAGHIKLFGLEDIYYGPFGCFLEGIYIELWAIKIGTDGFGDNTADDSYIKRGTVTDKVIKQSSTGIQFVATDVVGTSELGFFPTDIDGSSSTYFCDDNDLEAYGTLSNRGDGLFSLRSTGDWAQVDDAEYSSVGSRLCYF